MRRLNTYLNAVTVLVLIVVSACTNSSDEPLGATEGSTPATTNTHVETYPATSEIPQTLIRIHAFEVLGQSGRPSLNGNRLTLEIDACWPEDVAVDVVESEDRILVTVIDQTNYQDGDTPIEINDCTSTVIAELSAPWDH